MIAAAPDFRDIISSITRTEFRKEVEVSPEIVDRPAYPKCRERMALTATLDARCRRFHGARRILGDDFVSLHRRAKQEMPFY